MKKQKQMKLPRISADAIAASLKRGLGEDKAIRVAHNLMKELKGVGTEDVNHDFFNMKDIRKDERIWTQVHNILQKQAS